MTNSHYDSFGNYTNDTVFSIVVIDDTVKYYIDQTEIRSVTLSSNYYTWFVDSSFYKQNSKITDIEFTRLDKYYNRVGKIYYNKDNTVFNVSNTGSGYSHGDIISIIPTNLTDDISFCNYSKFDLLKDSGNGHIVENSIEIVDKGTSITDGDTIEIKNSNTKVAQFDISDNGFGNIIRNTFEINNLNLDETYGKIYLNTTNFTLNISNNNYTVETLNQTTDFIIGDYTNQETVTDGNGTGLKLSYKVANIFNITGDSTYSVTLTQGKNNNNVDNDNYKYEIERTSGSYSLPRSYGNNWIIR